MSSQNPHENQNYGEIQKVSKRKMNSKTRKQVMFICQAGLIAALYTVLTIVSAYFGLASYEIQVRISEALTVLPLFTPAAIPGLTVGCILGNISSPFGVWDIIFGSLATLLAAVCARKLRNIKIKGFPLLSILMPVIFNALIVGAEITFLFPTDAPSLTAFVLAALEVGAGELAVCLAGGIPLYFAINKTKVFK